MPDPLDFVRFRHLTVALPSGRCWVNDEERKLNPRYRRALAWLVLRPGELITPEDLWTAATEHLGYTDRDRMRGDARLIVFYLRRAIRGSGAHLITVHGRGFRLTHTPAPAPARIRRRLVNGRPRLVVHHG